MDGTWGTTPAVASGPHMYTYTTCVYTRNEKARHTWEKIFTKHIADNGLIAKIHGKKILKLKNTKTTKWKDLNWQLIRRVVLAIRHPEMLRVISPGELHCKTARCSLHLSDANQNRKQQELLLLGVKMRIHYPAELELMLLLTMWSNCGVPVYPRGIVKQKCGCPVYSAFALNYQA